MPSLERPSSQVKRKYVPLIVWFSVGMLLLVVVLPSALNLPQANPTTISEYAPVPPDEDSTSSDKGNLSSLGVASSQGLGYGAGEGEAVTSGAATGRKPITKRCVGKPARQTEDPMAPPCVPFFEGNNGGSTYQGVTKDEITVLAVMCWNCISDDDGSSSPPGGLYCDVEKPPGTGGQGCYAHTGYPERTPNNGTDHMFVKVVRALSGYFNERFQTYDRHVHFHVYWPHDPTVEENRRADAADNYAKLRPFAVIDRGELNQGGNRGAYAEAMADKKVVNVLNQDPQPAALMNKYPRLMWHVYPDVEHWAEMYVDYLCKRVGPYPVSHAQGGVDATGTPMNGDNPRRFGLFSTNDPAKPQYAYFADLVRPRLSGCGIKPAVEVTHAGPSDFQNAASRVAALRQNDVTTVLSIAGQTTGEDDAAAAQGYFPEIVVAGDGYMDRGSVGQLEHQAWFRNAWTVTPFQVREDTSDSTFGFQACREADPRMSRADIIPYCQFFYREFFLLFQMIQVAGPRLNPESIDRGLRTIPAISSTDPYRPSCYFDPGDYTCVKDAMEEWWDPDGESPQDRARGCWRMVSGGQRYRPGEWPGGDEVFDNQNDPCNGAGAFFGK